MANETVTIDISADGQTVTVEGENFRDNECKAVTKAVEEALGTVTRVKQKPEFFRTRVAQRTVKG